MCRHRDVAINELVLAQQHTVAELSAQSSKSRTAFGSFWGLKATGARDSSLVLVRPQARQMAPENRLRESVDMDARSSVSKVRDAVIHTVGNRP